MYLLFDIGGTNMRLAYSTDGQALDSPVVVPTPKRFEDGVVEFKRVAELVVAGRQLRAAAGGIAGTFDRDRITLLRSPNLFGWVDRPLRQELKAALEVPVVLENDAAVGGLGEAHFGAGIGHKIVAYITVGTGVGGARIVNGAIDAYTYGFEIGHQIIDATGTLCPTCDHPKDLETYVSGTSLERHYGKKLREINDPAVWDDLARFLAFGLVNTVVHWSPEIVILGGAMILKQPGIKIEDVARHLKAILTAYPVPPLAKAKLGDQAGLYGALILARA